MSSPPLIASDQLQPMFRLLRRMVGHWRAGLAGLAVGIVVTAAVSALRPKQYRSEAVVYYREGLQWTTNEGLSARRIGQRLKDTLLARMQLAKIVEELGLYPELVKKGRTAEAVEEMLAATGFRINDGDIFVISFTGQTPQQAQRVTAKLTDVLIGENTRLRAVQAEVAQAFLDSEKKRNEAELAARETELLRFLAKHPEFAQEQQGTVGMSLRARSRLEPEGDTALAALRREEKRLRRQIASPGQVPRLPQDPELVAARNEAETRLRAAQRELAERAARFTEQHPDVRSAAARAKDAEEAYRRAVADLEASERVGTPAALEARLAQVQKDIDAYARTNPKVQAKDTAGRSEAAQRVVALETEWTRLNRDVAEARERFQQLDSRQFMASMTLSTLTSGQAAQIVVIDPAYLPARPTGMRSQRLYLMGLGLSLVLGLGVMVLLALLDDRIRDRVDTERLDIAPVLAEVPRTPATLAPAPRPALPMLHAGDPTRSGDADAPTAALEGAMLVRVEPGPATLAVENPAAAGWTRPEVVRVHRLSQVLRADPRLLVLATPDSPAAASFRVLRHRLRDRDAGKVILVTSPGAGDGKTLCALNLALALAEGGQAKVLLLEANFRAPTLARLLGLRPPVCLRKQLAENRSKHVRTWDVAETASPWLHTIAVDPDDPSPPSLDGPGLGLLVADMRAAGYDHVVIDGPPSLGSADVNLIEESVDGILMVLRTGSSRAAQLRKAVDQIGERKLLGVVLLET